MDTGFGTHFKLLLINCCGFFFLSDKCCLKTTLEVLFFFVGKLIKIFPLSKDNDFT